jgi:hypothetical protein
MPFRNDAGLAAAELQLALEAAVLGTGSNDTVGTAGVVELRPGAVNSIPREARILIGENSFYLFQTPLSTSTIEALSDRLHELVGTAGVFGLCTEEVYLERSGSL